MTSLQEQSTMMIFFVTFTFFLIVPSFQLNLPGLPDLPALVDPDSLRDTCGVAIAKGYQCDNHTVTTPDGYILAIHRLYRNGGTAKKPILFLQHGLEDTSKTWVINMPSQSLGFIAADKGMDVWMGNMRGNIYSRGHTTYSTTFLNALIPSPYWNFTYDEMAKYDLPSMVQYVLSTTGAPNLYYIGHSQGTTIGFIQFSENPDWAKSRIKQFHALAPVSWIGHSTSIIRLMAPLDTVEGLYPSLGNTEFIPDNPLAAPMGTLTCPVLIKSAACTNFAMIFSGSTMDKENQTRNSVYAELPSGTSTLNLLKYARLMSNGKFETYGTSPVAYHPSTSLVPTFLYWSEKDAFTQKDDVAILKANLKTVVVEHKQNDYDHMDFLWSITAAQDLYAELLNCISTDFALP